MDEQEILKTIKGFAKKLPKFPDGRIDYSNSDIAPVVTVFAKFKDEILLLKRSDKVRVYQEKWDVVVGYLDELKPIKEKVLEELKEELGIEENVILSIHIGKTHKITDTDINKTWIICPVIVELKEKPQIKLDWEHTEFKWIKKEKMTTFDILTGLDKTFENAFM